MADVTDVMDNDCDTLQRDYARLGRRLRGVDTALCFVEQRAGPNHDEFVLCRAALQHRAAVQAMLEECESTGRYSLVDAPLQYQETVLVDDEPDFLVWRTGKTLAIRREAFDAVAPSAVTRLFVRLVHAGTVLCAGYLLLLLTSE